MRLNDISHHDYYEVGRMSVRNQRCDNDRLYIRSEPVREDYDRLWRLSHKNLYKNFHSYTKNKFGISDIFEYIEKSLHSVASTLMYGTIMDVYDQSGLLATISKLDDCMKNLFNTLFNTKRTLRQLSKERMEEDDY